MSHGAMLAAYAKSGHIEDIRRLLRGISLRSCNALITEFGDAGRLDYSKLVFSEMPERNVVSWNALISAIAKNGRPGEAKQVFEAMPCPDVVSWNSLIAAHAHNGEPEIALEAFRHMSSCGDNGGGAGVEPDKFTFLTLLRSCKSLRQGTMIHSMAVEFGFDSDTFVGTALVDMYGKCGNVESARRVFDAMPQPNVVSWTAMVTANATNERLEDAMNTFHRMPERNSVSWNAIIAACVRNGRPWEGLHYLHKMVIEGKKPDKITFLSALEACSAILLLELGKTMHAGVVGAGLELRAIVAAAIVNMYGKCGSLLEACRVFDRAASAEGALWNAMITAYAKHGHMEDARRVFNGAPERNVVSWNAMIGAYAQHGDGFSALRLFQDMMSRGVKPTKLTFVSILDACASLPELREGRVIHACVTCSGCGPDITLATALVNMYAKCGSVDDARHVFDKMPRRDAVSWTAMVAAYAQNGQGEAAFQLFKRMDLAGVSPNRITLIHVLCACSHAGLLEDGWATFTSMYRDHGIMPTAEHYACAIDLLGRAHRLDDAEEVICGMPYEPPFDRYAVSWKCLLGACRVHGDTERGAHAADLFFALESDKVD